MKHIKPILAGLCIVVLVVLVLPPPKTALAATQQICAGSPVPNGWILVNDFWDPSRCGNPTNPFVFNIWVIESYFDKPSGATMSVCAGAPTPANWGVTNTFWNPAACGHPAAIVNNMKVIKNLAPPTPAPTRTPTQTPTATPPPTSPKKLKICADSPVPAIYVKVNDTYRADKCGSPPTFTLNVWIIKRHDNKPIGAVMEVCNDAPTPPGWVITNRFWDSERCGHPMAPTLNVKVIQKTQSLFSAEIDYGDDPGDVYDDGGSDVIETPIEPGATPTPTPAPTQAYQPEYTPEPIWPGPTPCGNSGC